jgi:hypothetical protein
MDPGDKTMAMDEVPQKNPTGENAYLVVAALADGERVDPNALKSALDDPAVREYLVDLMALRQAVGRCDDLSTVQWRERASFKARVSWLSAAAAVVISLTAGYVAGQRTVQAAPAPIVETVVHLESAGIAPKPTRVIPLRPGINWTEKAGGQ